MASTLQDKQSSRKLMMLTEPIPGLIMKMALPTIVAFLITSIYSLADTYFVSQWGNTSAAATAATAAVSVNASLDQIIMMAGSMLAIGANSYVARLLGARKEEHANRVLSTAFFTAIGFGLVVLLLGTVFMRPMVRLLGATDSCEQYAVDYATYVLLVAPFMAANFVMNQCLRAEGSAMLSMVGMGVGGVLNCILDPIFIFNLDMGVAGASLATAISKIVSFCILAYPYVTGRSMMRISLRLVKFSRDIVTEVTKVGSSSLFRNGFAVLAGILLNKIAGNISDSVLAGIGVCTKVMMFPFSIILGFGTGFQPVVGFNWGAKRYDRVRESYRFSAWVAAIGSLVMAAVLAIFADFVIGLFAESDPEMMEIGALAIRLQCLALPVHAWVAVVNMYCAGLGDGRGALMLSTSRQGSCFLPILYPVAWLFKAIGVAAVQALADILSLALAIPILMRIQKKVAQAEKEAL